MLEYIGGWKLIQTKCYIDDIKDLQYYNNEFINKSVPLIEPNVIQFDDEKNIDITLIPNKTIIKGVCAGSGKSYLS